MKKIIIGFLIILAGGSALGQSGWQWQNPLPQGNDLLNVKFINLRIGYAIGKNGAVIKTTNGGLNWNLKSNCGGNTTLNTLSVIDSNIIFTCETSTKKIFKSTDGCNSWMIVNNTLDISDIIFTSPTVGYILNNNIYQTTNGGNSWNLSYVSNQQGQTVYFINDQTGFVSYKNFNDNSTAILRTTNQGSSWNICYTNSSYSFTVNKFSFVNSLTGYGIGDANVGALTKTTNGGVNWNIIGYAPSTYYNVRIQFVSDKTGFVSYTDGDTVSRIYKTTNDGIEWSTQFVNNGSAVFYYISTDTGYAVGNGGLTYKTIDGGNIWNCTNSIYNSFNKLNHVNFINENTGYAVGDKGLVFKTTNQGTSWNVSKLGSDQLNVSFFINDQTGFIGGGMYYYISSANPKLYKTTTGGNSWDTITISSSRPGVSTIYFINSFTGFMGVTDASTYGSIYKSTDGGISWNLQGSSGTINSIHFINQQTGYFCTTLQFPFFGYRSMIYKTTNSGNSWDSIYYSLAQGNINSIRFVSESVGFMNFSGYRLNKTTDGGISWFTVLNGGIAEIRNIGQYIIYSGSWKSTNQGFNWTLYDTKLNNYLSSQFSIEFLNESTGFIVGGHGAPTILKTTDGGEIISSIYYSQISNIIPSNFFLHQNYPNPFNPSTRINYELKITNYVTLKVFDLLGKEVASLVNEKQNAGSYAVDFNSSEYNLPSGIYFYTLSAGEFKETRKMILIK